MLTRAKKFFNYVYPLVMDPDHTCNIISGLFTTGASIASNFLIPYTLGALSEQLTAETTSISLFNIEMDPYVAVCILGGSFLISYSLPSVRSILLSKLHPNVNRKLLNRYVEHHLDQSLDYHQNVEGGAYGTLTNKCYNATQVISHDLFTQIFPTTIEIAIATGVLCRWYGLRMGLTLGGNIIGYIAYNFGTKNSIESSRKKYLKLSGKADTVCKSAIEQYESIHLSKTVIYTKKQINLALQKSADSESDYNRHSSYILLGQNIIISIGVIALCLFATEDILNGDLVNSDLVTIVSYLISIANPLSTLGGTLTEAIAAYTDLSMLFEVLEENDPIPDPFPNAPLQFNQEPDIEFRSVTFTHQSLDTPTLENVSFTIKAGEKAAIVGPSGSGKSTILNLMYRNYVPTSGQIFIGKQDINTCGLYELRKYISCIVQQPRFPNDTIFNIVASGAGDDCEEVTEEQVSKALSKAQLLDDVNKFPKKTKEKVGENDGSRLSGGQKQRLAISRGLIDEDPGLVIFDEATSALDSKTENAVQQQMDSINNTSSDIKLDVKMQQPKSNRRTTLFITHHLKTAENAKTIIVVKDGKVVGQGTHTALLADSKSEYAQLWQQQNGFKQITKTTAASDQKSDDKKSDVLRNSVQHLFLPPPSAPRQNQIQPIHIELATAKTPSASSSY